ncbi:hypothetical protein EDC01DRAFT_631033 [Geopyxis carbonaria]|nr:hypothetical protein EDC01DRAFT_631033 [Geopyxis carbonaria]
MRKSSLLRLPKELLMMIISFLDFRRDLNSLSLVSRLTLGLAQPALLHSAAVNSVHADYSCPHGYPPDTVLSRAALHNDLRLVRALAPHLRRLTLLSPTETTTALSAALLTATMAPKANCAVVAELLALGADPTSTPWGCFRISPMLAAADLRRCNVMDVMLHEPPLQVTAESVCPGLVSPLHLALSKKNVEMVSVIMRACPEIRARSEIQWPARFPSSRDGDRVAIDKLVATESWKAGLRALLGAGVHIHVYVSSSIDVYSGRFDMLEESADLVIRKLIGRCLCRGCQNIVKEDKFQRLYRR